MPFLGLPLYGEFKYFLEKFNSSKNIEEAFEYMMSKIRFSCKRKIIEEQKENLFAKKIVNASYERYADYVNYNNGKGIIQEKTEEIARNNGIGCDMNDCNIFVENYDLEKDKFTFVLVDQGDVYVH